MILVHFNHKKLQKCVITEEMCFFFCNLPLPLRCGGKISDFKHFRLGLKQKPVTVKEPNKAGTFPKNCVHLYETYDIDMMQIKMMRIQA